MPCFINITQHMVGWSGGGCHHHYYIDYVEHFISGIVKGLEVNKENNNEGYFIQFCFDKPSFVCLMSGCGSRPAPISCHHSQPRKLSRGPSDRRLIPPIIFQICVLIIKSSKLLFCPNLSPNNLTRLLLGTNN